MAPGLLQELGLEGAPDRLALAGDAELAGLAALIFVFWGQPSGALAVVITILLLVALALIGRQAPAGHPGGS